MSKGKLSFTQGDLTRALKAAVKAGLSVAGYEIDRDGKIVVRVGKPIVNEQGRANEWDKL